MVKIEKKKKGRAGGGRTPLTAKTLI